MSETQNPDHRRPLAPGEIRTHTVGNRTFKVMHVAGGNFTQASYQLGVHPTQVITTEMFEQDAVRAYADAIEQAESDAADADREDEAPEPLTAEGEEALRVRTGFAQTLDLHQAIAEAEHFEEIDRAAVARGESTNWWERNAETPEPRPGREILRQPIVDPAGALPTPAPTIADDVAVLRRLVNTYMLHTRPPGADAVELALSTLDRIAGAVPQRATDDDVLPEIWLDVERQCITLEINGAKKYRRWWFGKTDGIPAVEWCHGVHPDAIRLYSLGEVR
jgi:hypothetical protein